MWEVERMNADEQCEDVVEREFDPGRGLASEYWL